MRKTPAFFAASAALLIASCAAPGQKPAPVVDMTRAAESPVEAADTAKESETARPEAAPDERRQEPEEREEAERPDETAAKGEPKKPPPAIKPAALMGLGHLQLTRLMGVPRFRRIDDPAAYWQYRGKACILDLYLYADGPVYRVSHMEFRRRGGPGVDGEMLEGKEAERCFSALLPHKLEIEG